MKVIQHSNAFRMQAVREVEAGEVGEDEQGFPDIGGAVVQPGGDVWPVGGDFNLCSVSQSFGLS
jgi:hypothetical protein